MPALKSPGKILKLWKKANADYLKAAKAKELEPQESFHDKKIIRGLDRLRKVAVAKSGGQPDAAEFTDARDGTVEQMAKFRKLFKPRKGKDTVKKFYQTVCRLNLIVEQLTLNELDPDEQDPPPGALDDVDADALDQRDEAGAPQIVPGQIPEAPPMAQPRPAAKPEAPPADDSAESQAILQRLKGLMPRLQPAQAPNSPIAADVKARVSEANLFIRKKQYDQANDALDRLEQLLQQGKPAGDGQPAAAQAQPGPALAGWQAVRNAVIGKLKGLAGDIVAGKDPEASEAIMLINVIIKNLTLSPTTPQQIKELEDFLTNDDVIADACLAYDIRSVLLKGLQGLKT
jgi:hypothetical protein